MTRSALRAFLSGYLHQDWDVEYATAVEAAVDFVRNEPPVVVAAARKQLMSLLRADPPEQALQRYLQEAGCGYHPPGLIKDWLEQLAQCWQQQTSTGESL